MKKSEETLQNLQKKGYKRTKNREAILDIVYEESKPISANDILDKLEQRGVHPNKTTVYRKLDLLKKEGLIHEVYIDSTISFYERSDVKHHHHLICLNCHNVFDFHPEPDLEQAINKAEQKLQSTQSFTTEQHSLEFFGYCEHCQNLFRS